MTRMFYSCKNLQTIPLLNTSNVTDMSVMFAWSIFNSDISNWDVSNVTDKCKMFFRCPIKSKYKPKFK